MDTVYVIEQLWINERANHLSEAAGYRPIGFTDSREIAEAVVAKGGTYSASSASFMVPPAGTPNLRFTALPRISPCPTA